MSQGTKRTREPPTSAASRQERLGAYVESTHELDIEKLRKIMPNVEEIDIDDDDDLTPEEESYLANELKIWNNQDHDTVNTSMMQRLSTIRSARHAPSALSSSILASSRRVWHVFQESVNAVVSTEERRMLDSSNLALTLRMALTLTSDTGFSSFEEFEHDLSNRFVGTDEAPVEHLFRTMADGSVDYTRAAVSCVVRDDDHTQLKLVFLLKHTTGPKSLAKNSGGWHIQSSILVPPTLHLQ